MSPNSTTRSPDQPTNKYAGSLTSSQLTYETFEYTNDTASTQTAAHPDRAQERAHALDHPQKLPLHPKVVPTNADLKRSNMIDRYAGMRDPTFHATWDLSEIAKGSDHKGKAASVFSLSRPKKKTYDVAVTNPIIAAKAAEDQGKPTHGGGAGLGGLFRRGSRSSHAPDTAAAEGGKPSLIDESRDRKALFEEAERQAAYEAQQKERRDAELAEQQEQARKKAEQDKIRRKQEAAEAKERARAEKEREREAKRQSKLTVNTVNNGPPPRYSQAQAQAAGATGHSALSSPQPNTSGEDSASPVAEADEPLHAEGHRIGDEVPTRQNANQSNFNEEFSVLGFDGCAQPVQRREEDDTSSVSSSDGSSVTEEGAADHPVASTTDGHQLTDKSSVDAGTQTLVDAGVQTDPVEFASAGSSAPATVANATSSTQQRPRLAGPPVQLQDKVQFKDASKPDASTPANGVSRDDGKATRNSMTNASGGLKGLFRRLSRSRSNKNRDEDSTTRSNRLSASNKGSARTADAANWMPGQATAASQITTDDAKSMVTLDSMWVKKPKSSKKRSTHPVGPAFHLYHENGVHDSLYPSASESTTQKAPESHTSAFALYHSTGHHTTLYPEATSVPDERKELDVEDSFLPPAIPMKSHRRLGLAPASDAVAERELTSTA